MIQTNPIPPKEELHLLFEYKEGALYWRARRRGVRAGSPAGCQHADGYYWIHLNKVKYSRHRLTYAYFYGDPGSLEVDHINRIRGDDRIENLRAATRVQNKYNVSITKANKSGHKGVCWDKANGKWMAYIKTGNRSRFLGRYKNYEEAVEVYRRAAQLLHGAYLCLA